MKLVAGLRRLTPEGGCRAPGCAGLNPQGVAGQRLVDGSKLVASREERLQLPLSLHSSLRSCRVLTRSKMQKRSAARPQKRALQEADSQAGRMHAHRCPTPSLWCLPARARGPAPAIPGEIEDLRMSHRGRCAYRSAAFTTAQRRYCVPHVLALTAGCPVSYTHLTLPTTPYV